MENTTDNKKTQQEQNFDAICAFIDDLSILQEKAHYYFKPSDFDETTTASDLTSILEDCNAFDVEIIYYGRAMEYLSEHDASLTQSLTLAADMGYSPENIDSELLATLLASENARSDWYGHQSEIDEFISEMDWDEPEDEEPDEDEEPNSQTD